MSDSILPILWYFVIGASIIFYTILDGFDLGVGMLHLFTKTDQERRIFLNAIGPVWDGNEVWLVIVGGALFAGFPDVYATLVSGFYMLVMILLTGLIFRAVAIEFRSKKEGKLWRASWDIAFSLGSYIIAFGLGVVLGNLIEGLPITETKDFYAEFTTIFRPYPVLIGLLSIFLFIMHGAIFLTMKTEGALHEKMRHWVNRSIIAFAIVYLAATTATLLYIPHMTEPLLARPILCLIPLIAFCALLLVPYAFKKGYDLLAFGASCLSIALLFCLYCIGSYPIMARSSIDPLRYSLTVFNAASSPLTLKVLLIMVAIGIPMVLAYGTCIYRIFRGKVTIGPSSY